jgi:ABC-type branched-subunit amino acid transport system substrate-binding protein
MLDDGGGMQVELGGFSSLMTPAKSWKWLKLEEDYYDAVGQPASFYTSADYDAGWSLALSAIEASSTSASDIAPLWPTVPRNFYGASGWVDLDNNGDRKPGIFDIWGYTADGFTSYGQYNGIELTVNWNDVALEANGFTRPGPH